MKLIFAGSGEFGLPTLRALVAQHEVVQVFSQPDRPAGRGRKVIATPISQFAAEQSLPLKTTADINLEPPIEADVMVVIAFGQKIGPAAVNHPRWGSINLHASRLPKYRGAAPINWAILNGDKTTGNSVIRLAQKMDAGAILGQSEIPIGELETAGELHSRLAIDGVALVLKVLGDLQQGQPVLTPQIESRATQAPKLSREIAKIDWALPAAKIACWIHGLHPWPGCRVQLADAANNELDRFTLVRARPAAGEGARWSPGEVGGDGFISVADGSHAIEIIELQPEGKRPMPLADYRRGHAWMPGMRLQSI